jgi:hypothetical protein
MRLAAVALLISLPLLSGCAAVVLLPRAIEQLTEGPASATGFEFHRTDGATETGQPFRIRHFLDLDARHWHVVTTVDGKTFSSRRDDITSALQEARAAYPGTEGKTEAEVTARYGAPHKQSRFEDVRVLWYVRERERGVDDVFVLVFRQDRCVTGFRTNRTEMERILDRPSPWARARDYGPSTPWTNRELTVVR